MERKQVKADSCTSTSIDIRRLVFCGALSLSVASIVHALTAPLAVAKPYRAEIGPTSIVWDLSPEQIGEIAPLLATLQTKSRNVDKFIISRRHQMDKLFMQPAPDRKPILTLQGEIDKSLEDLRLTQWKTALAVRKMLTSQQRKALGCLGPELWIPGQKLTAAQLESYYRLMRPYLVTSLNTSKRLVNLRRDQTELLQEMDMVHGCHAMKLDLPALLANQKQINAANSEMSMERLRVAISIHALLTPDQRSLFMQGCQIRLPDPIGVKLESEDPTRVPPPEKVFKNTTLTAEQKAKYQAIMAKEVQTATASKRMRDELIAHRLRMLSAPRLDVAALETVQGKINETDSIAAIDRILTVARVRDILTPEQRHLVFNRHHPKIWRDTGINKRQDEKLMAIHMKIEEADRKGMREMLNLASDMERYYYSPADNDDQIIAAQAAFDKAQKQMEVAQLNCLFEGRDVLTKAQKLKLVELMEDNKRATH